MGGFRLPGVCLGLAFLLAAAPARSACGPPVLERVVVDRILADGVLVLKDQRQIRLAGLHLVGHRPDDWPRPGDGVALGLLSDETDRWSRYPGLVFALPVEGAPVWLQQRLLESGAAVARPEADLGDCWPLLAKADAVLDDGKSLISADAGRYARIAGRVQRVGDGRSAHFITLYEPSGARVAGMIQKRHLKRFKDAGVDVAKLQGHVIRMRGVRSAANPAVIPLTSAEQIEIMR